MCLPLAFGGGRLVVEQESRATFDWETRSYFASSPETEARRIRWAAFFGDVDHRIETVTSGCRATLTYELRRAPDSEAAVPRQGSEAEAAFTAALAEALADPEFVSDGGRFGMPCLHLYAVPTGERTLPEIESLRDYLKGRDRLVAIALERAGLVPRVVPYVFETCAGESWRLRRDASVREKQIFAQKRLKGSSLERRLPIDFHADWNQSDDVTWLVRPPWVTCIASQPTDDRSRLSSCSGKPNTARRTTSETRRRTCRSTPPPRSSSTFRRSPQGVQLEGIAGLSAPLVLRRDDVAKIELVRDETPGPKAVRVSGTLDTISATKSDIVLTLADGTTVAARLDGHDNDLLKTLFGSQVVVAGMARFRPSGTLLVIDIEHLGPARGGDALFETAPKASATPVASLLPQDQTTGVSAFFGTWPGDETDDELLEALQVIE